jgi:hypothetical protein
MVPPSQTNYYTAGVYNSEEDSRRTVASSNTITNQYSAEFYYQHLYNPAHNLKLQKNLAKLKEIASGDMSFLNQSSVIKHAKMVKLPISSVQMAKDLYRKGQTVSQSSSRKLRKPPLQNNAYLNDVSLQ